MLQINSMWKNKGDRYVLRPLCFIKFNKIDLKSGSVGRKDFEESHNHGQLLISYMYRIFYKSKKCPIKHYKENIKCYIFALLKLVVSNEYIKILRLILSFLLNFQSFIRTTRLPSFLMLMRRVIPIRRVDNPVFAKSLYLRSHYRAHRTTGFIVRFSLDNRRLRRRLNNSSGQESNREGGECRRNPPFS